MSEYGEKHSVSRLIGAPPGYVGFEQGGLLVDAVRQHPYSVVLLDEIEKAHPDLMGILLQVMDSRDAHRQHRAQGRLPPGDPDHDLERRLARDEPGHDRLRRRPRAGHEGPRQAGARALLHARSSATGSTRSSTFKPLTPAVMETIVDKFVLELEAQLRERKVAIELEPAARTYLAKKGFDPVFGARPLSRLVQTEVRNPLTDEILFGQLEHGGTVRIGSDGEKLDLRVPPEPAAPGAARAGGADGGRLEPGRRPLGAC